MWAISPKLNNSLSLLRTREGFFSISMTSLLYCPLLFIIFVTDIYAELRLSSTSVISRSGGIYDIAIVDGMSLQSINPQHLES